MPQDDFFISYSKSIYNNFVKNFVKKIKSYGINLWLDRINVHLGDEILSNLFNVLDSFKKINYGVIIIFDSTFFKKKWCITELEYIKQNKISFFPILFHMEKTNIPEKYKYLRNYNMVTIRDEKLDIENAISKILDIYIYNEKTIKKLLFRQLFLKHLLETITMQIRQMKWLSYLQTILDSILKYGIKITIYILITLPKY